VNSIDRLNQALNTAALNEDRAERSIHIAAIIAEAFRGTVGEPILVGGAAVEFYTQGGYSTADIDMVIPGGPEVGSIMKNLGFEKLGKDFIDKKRQIYIEFPSNSLKPSERFDVLQVGERSLHIISLEDLIIDRLCAFKFWRSAIDGVNALLLLELGQADQKRLLARAHEEDVHDALEAVQQIREEVIRKKVSTDEANKLLKAWMNRLLA
jgi:hypothetical protein